MGGGSRERKRMGLEDIKQTGERTRRGLNREEVEEEGMIKR